MKNRLREARKSRKITAVELADKLQVHPSTIANWEADRKQIMPDKLVQIAKILGFTVDYLLGIDSPQVSLTEPVSKESLHTMHGQPEQVLFEYLRRKMAGV